jgi:CarboxypepD_reg-like domain
LVPCKVTDICLFRFALYCPNKQHKLAMKLKLTFLILVIAQFVFGQGGNITIEGRILDKTTQAPVPYANIFNRTLQKGTISNDEGYFRLEMKGVRDSILISFIGYKAQYINLQEHTKSYTVLMEESALLLGQVVVTPKLNAYLFELVANCKKNPSKVRKSAKAYYELKSYRDTAQVELVEGFYNIGIHGYDIDRLQLKAGRLAMQPLGNRYFASMESSMAITLSKLMEKNPSYPTSPLDLTRKAMMKNYYLYLGKKYLSEGADSVYVIDFEPIARTGRFYEGTIWVNKTKNNVLKINLRCKDCKQHPFLPMFPTDSISNVSLNITMTFTPVDGGMVFNHVDFIYAIKYKSRPGQAHEQIFTVKTQAVLYAFDFTQQFELPKIEYASNTFRGRDYRLINAMPYNDFFWENNDEYKLNERNNLNKNFFESPASLTNKIIFKQSSQFKRTGLLEHPFVHWSSNRVKFREVVEDTSQTGPLGGFNSEKYKLAVKIFVDINRYNDSTDIRTATIFDPYESYYYLPIDNKAMCFINLFFDFCEINRRKLEASLKAVRHDPEQLKAVQAAFDIDFEAQKKEILKTMEHGTKEAEVLKWNDYVRGQLGIDNALIFKPFQKKENSE